MIGDDDGVNPEIVEAAAWAKTKNVDCLAVRNAAWLSLARYGCPVPRFSRKWWVGLFQVWSSVEI